MVFPEIPGVEINLSLLLFIGFGTGILSGFAGVGGAFIVTPALIILGFPAHLAVGTGLAWVVGNTVVAALGHRRLGNVDVKLGLVILIGSMSGMEVGVRVLNWLKESGLADQAVLSVVICMLLIVGSYTFLESIRRKRELDLLLREGKPPPPAMRTRSLSQRLQSIRIPPVVHFSTADITVSAWIILAVGFVVGVLAGVMGVGGGFLMVPSLVYLVGLPSFVAVGTDLFQIIFSASYGSIRHTMSGNVVIFAAFIMVIASSIGVQYGVVVTRYVRGVSVRMVLGIAILLFALGTLLKLLGVFLGETNAWLDTASMGIVLGSMWLTLMIILALFILGLRYRQGRRIPQWAASLVSTEETG